MRHAWLIITHNEFGVLQRLVSMLDAPESDFYIHFDKKVRVLPTIRVEKGNLHILEKRIDVCWGTVSQIKVELLLLETAWKNGPYQHYHILSGTHLPLKSVEKLFAFYNSHAGEEIMRFWPQDEGDADFKLRRYHFPIYDFKSKNLFRRRLCQLTWRGVIKFQKIFGIRHLKNDTFIKTDQWLSLTEMANQYLVNSKKNILKKYKYSFCGDEYFVASELQVMGDQFKLFDCQNLLYVDFVRDSPKSLPLHMYQELQATGFLWARKFTAPKTD